jgi:hypothetical protein
LTLELERRSCAPKVAVYSQTWDGSHSLEDLKAALVRPRGRGTRLWSLGRWGSASPDFWQARDRSTATTWEMGRGNSSPKKRWSSQIKDLIIRRNKSLGIICKRTNTVITEWSNSSRLATLWLGIHDLQVCDQNAHYGQVYVPNWSFSQK